MEKECSVKKKANIFSLSLKFYLSVDGRYDYTMDYMANIARAITRKYPAYHVHKKSEDKIKAFLSQMITEKIEKLGDSHVSNLCVTEITEISEMVAEYPAGMEGADGRASSGPTLPGNNPSFGTSGLELSMAVDTGSSDIKPVAFSKQANDAATGARPVRPNIMKRTVVRASVTLDVATDTRMYLYLIQELPELFSLKELEFLRVRLAWQHTGTRFLEEPDPIEIKIVENRTYSRWFIGFLSMIILCFIGITSLFFAIPNLYKQDIHFMRSDTINQNVSIRNSQIDLQNVTLDSRAKDSLIIRDKKVIIAK